MYGNDPEVHGIASEFFRTFARIEYALKAAGFLVKCEPKRKCKADADWGLFAAAVHATIAASVVVDLRDAINFILAEPPRKQVNVDNLIEWDATPPTANNSTELVLR